MNLKKELKQLENMEKEYFKVRMDFVERWAKYVKTHPRSDWSKQHNEVINKEMKKLQEKYKNMTREEYMNIRCELCQTPKSLQHS